VSGISWGRVKAALAATLAAPRSEREARLREVCAGDALLEAEVRALLASEEGGRRLDRLSVDLWTLPGEARDPAERVGGTVDGHPLVGFLGAGGMADVYEAEEAVDGRVERVALKLLRKGAASRFSTRRFEVERSGLRRLRHPGIARFRSSGVAEDGTPYYTMDLVVGEPMDAWCDARRLPLAARVRLLVQVCEAVQHAHEAGVVHRDIKPTNVLVREDGTPVLLDFGIAKLLGEEGTGDPGTVTRESLSLTPLYASPEQVEGEAVSAASDVFALGAVGYRLAVGALPSDAGRRPPPPSALLPGDVEAAAAVAEARRSTPRELVRALRSGLDRILAKACARKPSRRHRSAAEMGERLRRWADRPA